MQIVIDISNKLYDRYKEKDHIKRCDIDELEKALDRCIILPKGHGRLIDAGAVIDNLFNSSLYDDDYYYSIAWHKVKDTPTIVEADKEK